MVTFLENVGIDPYFNSSGHGWSIRRLEATYQVFVASVHDCVSKFRMSIGLLQRGHSEYCTKIRFDFCCS